MRSKIKFNVASISDSIHKAIVNNATMELTLAQSTIGLGSPDSLLALIGLDSALPDSVGLSYYAYGYRKDPSQTTNIVYTFSMTSMIQQWISSPSNNFGVVVRSATEPASVDNHLFYSSKDSTRAPKVFITYTKK